MLWANASAFHLSSQPALTTLKSRPSLSNSPALRVVNEFDAPLGVSNKHGIGNMVFGGNQEAVKFWGCVAHGRGTEDFTLLPLSSKCWVTLPTSREIGFETTSRSRHERFCRDAKTRRCTRAGKFMLIHAGTQRECRIGIDYRGIRFRGERAS